MDLKKKLEVVGAAVRSISTHSDEDSSIVKAALDQVVAMIEDEKVKIDVATAKRIADLT